MIGLTVALPEFPPWEISERYVCTLLTPNAGSHTASSVRDCGDGGSSAIVSLLLVVSENTWVGKIDRVGGWILIQAGVDSAVPPLNLDARVNAG